MTHFTYEIDLGQINKGVKSLDALSKKIYKECTQNAIDTLYNRLVTQLKQNISYCGYPDLVNYIKTKKTNHSIQISIENSFVKFLEYGTGIKGANQPNPKASKIGWAYRSGKYSGRGGGWYYPATKVYGHQKSFISKRDGQLYAYTNGGLPAGMFMYKTEQYAQYQATRVFRKFLRRAIEASGGKVK